MTALLAPTAPPQPNFALADAPPTAPAAAPLAISDVAAWIAGAPDPAAALSALVLQVSALLADGAARQGGILSVVKTACDRTLKSVRTALLQAVTDTPGAYAGFTVTERAGSRSIDYKALQDRYPHVFDELVRFGEPSLVIAYAS